MTKKLASNQYEHTFQNCVNCIKVKGAVRILKTASIPATKATEHLAICEGPSDGEQHKFAAQIPACGGLQHSFVTHDMRFEGDAGNHDKGLGKRSVNEDERVGEGVGGGGKGVSGSSGAAGGSTGPSPSKSSGKISQYTHSCSQDQANPIIFALMQLLTVHALPFTLVESCLVCSFAELCICALSAEG